MYKNQLQELAQRSCFNLPSYACIREGPDHGPRFKATVNFNGEIFESPTFFSTLRQAENAAAEVALNTLAKRGPSRILAAKVLDESGVYKNLLQETAHRAGLNLPSYTTVCSGPGHVPVFSCTVELAGIGFTGELAKTKKQAQKNAAMSAWHALKQMSQRGSTPSPTNSKYLEEQEQVVIARFLATLNPQDVSDLPQGHHQKGHQRPTSTFKTSYSSTPNVVASHDQSWVSSNFTPEMAMHHIWLQEHQRRLMGLGISIPIVPLPVHVSPWTHPFYFPNQIFPDPFNSTSMVVSPEILVENPDNFSELSSPGMSMISNNPGFVMDKKLKDKDKIEFLTQNKNTASFSFQRLEKESSEHASSQCTSSGVQTGEAYSRNPVGPEPSTSSKHVKLGATARASLGPSIGYNQRIFQPPLSDPRSQTGINSFPRRPIPMLGRMQAGSFHAPFRPPAIQIRSVVPVCSAAPPRKTPPTDDGKSATAGDVSGMSSNLESLNI